MTVGAPVAGAERAPERAFANPVITPEHVNEMKAERWKLALLPPRRPPVAADARRRADPLDAYRTSRGAAVRSASWDAGPGP